MHIPDLSSDTYIGHCALLRSIGWLGRGHAFVTGDAPVDLVPLLEKHLEDHWCCFACGGSHGCEFCEDEGRRHSDSRNLFIPGKNTVYFAPGMIVHYIQRHHYLPSEEFIEALRQCPPQGGEEFMTLITPFGEWMDARMPNTEDS